MFGLPSKLGGVIVRPLTFAMIGLLTVSCGGSSTPTPTPTPTPAPTASGPVTIEGTITFESVPFSSSLDSGLDFASSSPAPARFVVVDVVNASGAVLDSDVTDSNGDYSVTVNGNMNVRIQAKAQIIRTTGATFDFPVLDNTNGNAQYVLQGSLTNSGSTNSTRDLFADSGFGMNSYTGPRNAAPFAILDTILDAVLAISEVTPNSPIPTGQVFWSVNNVSAGGNVANGEIGTTSFTMINGVPTLLVLGDADVDTDEYDGHIIAHEFGHYVEATLARSDSLGGQHVLGAFIDPRVALSEGYANAFSGIVEVDPVYRDSFGQAGSRDFSFNIESNDVANNPGWFSEVSVHSILFDVVDGDDDGADQITGGFGALHLALTSDAYISDSAPTTIFSLIAAIRAQAGVDTAALDALARSEQINGMGSLGAGETNNGGIASVLPVVQTVSVNGMAVEICSIDDQGTFNALGNRAFLWVSLPSTQTYTFTMVRLSGDTNRDPDFIVFQQGSVVARSESTRNDETEQLVQQLNAGEYFIDAYDFRNLASSPASAGGQNGDACYAFTVSD